MSTLYRPVLIESVEQAEALPEGTYAKNEATTGSGTWHAPPRVNIGRGMWSGDDLYRSADLVGWTALVPIEAEEEHARNQINITHMSPPAPQQVPVLVPCPRCGLR